MNTRGTEGVPSFSPAQPRETTREESCANLMERVVARDNMSYALYRVESNKGAAGIDELGLKERVAYSF